MKKLLLLAIPAFLVIGCQNNTKDDTHSDGTHVHEDGSVHHDHDADTISGHQEEFEVDPAMNENMHDHGHDGDHDHAH